MKVVLDADGAIKLAKAELLGTLAVVADCFMAVPAYQEALQGKEKMYEDAFAIEALQKAGKITVETVAAEKQEWIGTGEWSTLKLFQKLKADSIISDDRKFLAFLEKEEVPFMSTTDSIVLLVLSHRCTKEQAWQALDKIRLLVREENYLTAREKIGGM